MSFGEISIQPAAGAFKGESPVPRSKRAEKDLSDADTAEVPFIGGFRTVEAVSKLGYHYFVPLLLAVGVSTGHVRIGRPDNETAISSLTGISQQMIALAADTRDFQKRQLEQTQQDSELKNQLVKLSTDFAAAIIRVEQKVDKGFGNTKIRTID